MGRGVGIMLGSNKGEGVWANADGGQRERVEF